MLFTLTLKRYGDVKYAGLLATLDSGGRFKYVLMDPTGITLLEAALPEGGPGQGRSAGPLAGSGLHDFLTTALARIFFQTPQRLPCDRSGLLELCQYPENDTGWRKIGRIWPFPLWSATANTNGQQRLEYTYKQPWLGVQLLLEQLGSSR